MMAEVVQLKRPVDQEVVGLLEEALEQARAGEINGVLVMKQDPNGVSYVVAGIRERFTVLGWLSHAQYCLQSDE